MEQMGEGKIDYESDFEVMKSRRKELGKQLKRLREDNHHSIKDIAHLTRISVYFVEALEAGELEKLPGEVFGRGFIKGILKALDEGDEQKYLQEFDQCWNADSENKEKNQETKSRFHRQIHQPKKHNYTWHKYFNFPGKMGLFILFLIAVVCFNFVAMRYELFFYKNRNSPSHLAENTVVSSAKQPAKALSKDIKVTSPEKPKESAVKNNPKPEQAAAEAEQYPKLIVKVLETVKIKSRQKGEPFKVDLYEPGQYTFNVMERFEIYFFDISSVQMQFEEKTIPTENEVGEKKMTFYNKEIEFDQLNLSASP